MKPKIYRGSKDCKKNMAIHGVMINGLFVHTGMNITVTGYNQDNMNDCMVTVSGVVDNINDCYMRIYISEDTWWYIHIHGVKAISVNEKEDTI